MAAHPLGRIAPQNFDHVEAMPLRALGDAGPSNVPVSIGTNWYTDFDSPRQLSDGSWHLPSAKQIRGTIRGGHCTCLAPAGAVKVLKEAWRVFYNQDAEGACEGFGHARTQTLIHYMGASEVDSLDGVLFDAWDLYDRARELEGTYPSGEGTTNKAVCEVLEQDGIRPQRGYSVCTRGAYDGPADPGIASFRWATTAEEVCGALGRPGAEAVPLLNSWGTAYPMVVWLPTDTLERLLEEGGEADVVADA